VETNGSCTKTFGPVKLSKYETCKIPVGISPNGDGLNDSFVLDWLASNPGIDILQIYDRRGVLVYEKDNYIDEFVGKNNDGNDLPAASYYYIIKLLNGEKMTGWFQLVR
jgi:gliding motility-associated-like protein